jgi:hypothetical protein
MSRFWRAILISATATGAAWATLAWLDRHRLPTRAQASSHLPPVIDAEHLPEDHRDQMLAELESLV